MAGDSNNSGGAGAGSWSLKGFDYQVDVSVWLALDLMVANRLASEMILEHVSEEDVEADVDELEAGTVAESVALRSYRLIVQAKRRTGNAWTEAKYISLLKHGERRKSAIKRLEEDSNARYLLVTSAALNDPVRSLGVRHAGTWPAASKVSPNIAAAGVSTAGRLAIIGGEDDERLQTDIKTLLLERFRVPRAGWEDCLEMLRKAAWDLMGGLNGGRWTREEVEKVITEHEGYLVSGSERDGYVQPTNWGDLTQALANRHAIMIIGQSGSGKTATAEALWLQLKADIPDLKRVHITHGPDQLRTDNTVPPVLYDIEDPWGRFKFEPDSRPWNDQLAPAFESARHDRILIATSRSDVAEASRAESNIQRWRMPLNAENYGRPQLRQLYRNLSKGLPSDLAAFVHEYQAVVLGQLSLPLELRKFFDGLPELDRDELAKHPQMAVTAAIERAHQNSIERTVVDQLEARDAIKPAAVLWALVKPYGRLSADVLRSLDDALVDADPSLEGKISTLVNSFVTGRNLRQGADGSLAYYHGKVEAGIETALAGHPQAVRRTLRQLIDALLTRDEEQGGNWGVETAAEIIRLSQRIAGATPQPSRVSQDRLDRLVECRLKATGRDLEDAVRLAAAVGSSSSNLSEMARWLEFRPDRSFPGLMNWGKPEQDESWYARMRADPEVRALAESFVETLLPTDQTHFPQSFARDLAEVAGNMTDAFLAAALESAAYGYIPNDDIIAAGALADLDRFEPVVDASVVARQPTQGQLDKAARDRLRILNDEVSEEYAEHLADNDDGATADTYLAAYVHRLRKTHGWKAVAQHRHHSALRHYWLRELGRPSIQPAASELEAAVDASYGTDVEELLWSLLADRWDDCFRDRLAVRLVAGHDNSGVRQLALDCLAKNVPDEVEKVISALVVSNADGRLAEFASDLGCRAGAGDKDASDRHDPNAAMISALPRGFAELALAKRAILEGKTPTLSHPAVEILMAIPEPTDDVRSMRVRLARHMDLDVTEDVKRILMDSDDREEAIEAIEIAIRRDMRPLILGALDHRFAHVAAKALSALADPLLAPLPTFVLDRANRTSSPVRKAVLAQLSAKPHPDHLRTLRLLTADDWSQWAQRENDDGNYPIARDAVKAISALEVVPDDVIEEFIDRARVTEDIYLMSLLLSCAVRHGGQARQSQIVEMSRKGSRIVVGQAAACALFEEHESLTEETARSVRQNMVMQLPAMIASYHALTMGMCSDLNIVDGLATALSASDDRRIFLALLALILRDRAPERADAVAAMLPEGHPARRWAIGEPIVIEKPMLIDLGDAAAVNEAFRWMQPTKS